MFSDDWDNWQIGSDIKLRTTFSNDFDGWELRGNGKTIYIKTTFSDDYERWSISGDVTGTIRTTFSDNYERWDIQLNGSVSEELEKGIVFVAIFTAFHLNK